MVAHIISKVGLALAAIIILNLFATQFSDIQGSASVIATPPQTPSPNSLSLNGTGAYLNVPNSTSLNITGAVTLEACAIGHVKVGTRPVKR